MTRGELAETQRAERRAAELEQPSSPWHDVAVNVYGITLRWMGHGQRAEQVLTSGISAARANGTQVMPIVYSLGQLAALCAERLGWPRAREVAGEALRVADEHAVGEHWVCGIAHLVRGRVLSGSGDLPAGQAALLRGVKLAQRGAGPLDVAWGTLALAGVLAAAGDQPAARVALARAHTTLAGCPDPVLELPDQRGARGAAQRGYTRAALINDLAALDEDVHLVLDDYHVLTDPELHRSVAYLLAHQPPRLHLVIATRRDPPLPFARLRAHGEILEIRANDLAFTDTEATTMLNGAMALAGLRRPGRHDRVNCGCMSRLRRWCSGSGCEVGRGGRSGRAR